MDFHAGRGKIILFGGKVDGGLKQDTWSWDGGNDTWTDISASVGSPQKRTAARMVYDQGDGYLVMFGGCTGMCASLSESSPDTVVNDTLTLDGGRWFKWATRDQPSIRCCVGMAFFPSPVNRVLVFGGADENANTFDDLWKWEAGQKKWVCLSGTCTR